jgi:flap endonuclease-1
MGLNFKEIIVKEEISFDQLKNKILVIDSMNLLYQFLTTIRSIDGSVLMDNNGNVTSHIIGLFSRTTKLMSEGLKLAFVFDGQAPEIKQKTKDLRKEAKLEAGKKFKLAEEEGDLEKMKMYSSRTAILTKKMVEDAQEIIKALGLPVIQAPSEGEAQAAYMVKKGDAYASISQDYDNLIFSCPRLIRNLSLEGKRKKAGMYGYVKIKPEMILLKDVLDKLELNIDQLIILAILVGTDYNPGGIKGIGPKKGLNLIKKHENFADIFKEVKWSENYPDLEWEVIYDTIKNIPVTDDYELVWSKVDEEKLKQLLIEKHSFEPERVNNKLELLTKTESIRTQKGLSSYF